MKTIRLLTSDSKAVIIVISKITHMIDNRINGKSRDDNRNTTVSTGNVEIDVLEDFEHIEGMISSC